MGILNNFIGGKTSQKRSINVGDWVNSCSKGIYRVEKIIGQYYDESSPDIGNNNIGDKRNDRIVVSKRLLNSKYKKSIGYESCSEFFVSHLDSNQEIELREVLAKNPKLLDEIDKYEVPTLITVYNSNLQIDNEDDLQKVNELVEFIKEDKSFVEIQTEMKRLDILRLKPRNFGNYSFQLVSYNHEYLNRRLIWRDAKLTKV